MEAERRKRVNFYKKLIVYVFFIFTIVPSAVSLFLIHKVNELEENLDILISAEGADIYTLLESSEALEENPHADTDALANMEEIQSLEAAGENVIASGGDDVETEKRVYLTFDDGPSIYTGQILDILAENDVKATFFVIGRDDESYWPYYQRIVEEGHTLGMHSYTHKYDEVYASVDAFTEDITKLSDLLYQVTGVRSTIFRFPGGSSNTVSDVPMENFIAYLNEQGITYYDWNALNGDAVSEELPPDKLVENVMTNVRQNNTSIVLMHDIQSRHTTVESLQLLIDTLKSEGYQLLPIDENTPLIQHIPSSSVESSEGDTE